MKSRRINDPARNRRKRYDKRLRAALPLLRRHLETIRPLSGRQRRIKRKALRREAA